MIDQSILLKTSHTLVESYREIKQELRWEIPTCWLSFIMLASNIQAAGGENDSSLIYLLKLKYQTDKQGVSLLLWWHIGDGDSQVPFVSDLLHRS